MPLLVVYNPVCGDGSAQSLVADHIQPLLEKRHRVADKIVATERPGHAGEIVRDFVQNIQEDADVSLILCSGDGTLHEIINSMASVTPQAGSPFLPRLNIALVPCGTANALYSSIFSNRSTGAQHGSLQYKLQSIDAYLRPDSLTIPLTLAITTLSHHPAARLRPQAIVSSVVTSTSLHAHILRDSESLRKEIPGIDRFKLAAEKNSTKWYQGSVKLLPAAQAGVVQIYDPATKRLVDHPDSHPAEPIIDLDGPFAYFLSTTNVDRLEPTFRIAPLASAIPPAEATCDVVIIRPMRDPTLSVDIPSARQTFRQKLWATMKAAYDDGRHIDLRYAEDGQLDFTGDGLPVVEYIRCGGWEWFPDDEDEDARLLCSDGSLVWIEPGGRAVCSAARPQNNQTGFAVYA